jgi:hypothetical protein
MTFTEVVLRGNGDVVERREHSCAAIRAGGDSGELARLFGLLFAIVLPPDRPGPLFRYPVCEEPRAEVLWLQAEPYTAAACLDVRGLAACYCLLLSGRDPASEAAELAALQRLLVGVLAETGCEPGFGLLSITERPALVRIEACDGLSRADRRLVSDLALSATAVFFERVATRPWGRIDQG